MIRASCGGGAAAKSVCCATVSECLTPIGLTMTSRKEKKKKAPVEYVFYLNTVDHACTLLEYFKVLSHVVNRAKSIQPVCGNCDFNETLCRKDCIVFDSGTGRRTSGGGDLRLHRECSARAVRRLLSARA